MSHRPHLSGLKPQRPVWLCTLVLCSVGSLVGKGCPGLGWRVQRQVVHSLGCCEAAEGWGRGAVGAARASWSCGAGHPRQGPLEPRGRGTAPRGPEGHQQGPARLTQGGVPPVYRGARGRRAFTENLPWAGVTAWVGDNLLPPALLLPEIHDWNRGGYIPCRWEGRVWRRRGGSPKGRILSTIDLCPWPRAPKGAERPRKASSSGEGHAASSVAAAACRERGREEGVSKPHIEEEEAERLPGLRSEPRSRPCWGSSHGRGAEEG